MEGIRMRQTVVSRKWVEVVLLFGGSYSVAYTTDDNNNTVPYLYDSKQEAETDQESITKDYLDQIARGERDEGDLWDGEIFQCELDGDELRLYDGGVCFNVLNWKDEI